MQDYYEILGVPHFCDSAQDLRKAYKEQVLFFHPDKGNVNAPPQPLVLTVDYTGSLGINLEQDTDAAQIRFSENVWYGLTTKLEVIPEHPGITVFTFGNDRNNVSFRVRVIVL